MKRPAGFDAPRPTSPGARTERRAPERAAPQRSSPERSSAGDRSSPQRSVPERSPAGSIQRARQASSQHPPQASSPVQAPNAAPPQSPERRTTASAAPRQPPPAARVDRQRVRSTARLRRRAELAEVRRFTRRSRRRRRVLLGAAVVLVLLTGIPIALAVSPVFAVRRVVVLGADAGLTSAVSGALAGQVGVPLALVDRGRLQRAIASVPGVQTYSVESLPPGTLEVRVVPRTAIAQVVVPAGYARVDAARVTLATAPTRFAGLPLVVVPAGAPRPAAAFRGAAAVIRALPGALARRVATVTATTPDAVSLTLRGGRRVTWGGVDDSAAKATALQAALVHAAHGAHVIDVSAPGVVTTR